MADLRTYYQEHDDFTRYTVSSRQRIAVIRDLYRSLRKYFGWRIMDIGCGGGVLGFVVEPHGHKYLGVDLNPDMIGAAKEWAKNLGLRNIYILGDAADVRVAGKVDTFTSIGNGLCHISTGKFVSILKNINRNAHPGSSFILEYRDVVEMLFNRVWARRYVEKRKGRILITETRSGDFENGTLTLKSHQKGQRRSIVFKHSIWSPFIMAPLMQAHGWQLVRRQSKPKWHGWVDVYGKTTFKT